MSYILKLTPIAIEDIEFHKRSGDKSTLKKLSFLFSELVEHPKTGTGKPEEMKYNFVGCWSRRINNKHRLVYRIDNEIVTVIILQARGHYSDK
jgi:toxin YoeB